MNIALFASAFHPHIGGVEEHVRQLAHEQVRRGDRPLIVTNRWPKDLPPKEEVEGLPVRRYVFRVPERTLKQLGGSLVYGAMTLRHIVQDLRTYDAQAVHVECVSSNAYYALLAKRRLKLPMIVTLHGELSMDATRLFQRSAFARKLLCDLLTEADAITACSAQTLAEAEAFWGKPFGERGRVVYNGIRLSDFAGAIPFDHPRPYILGIGRHVKQKGFDVLLQAFAQVVSGGNSSHDLLLAGDGVEHANLKTLTAELGLTDRVHFVGRVGRTDAVRLFTGCSVFVLPSRHEPMGIVNLEAMAAGKAVIASRVGGVPELVQDNQTGLLVPPDDVPSLTAALARILQDKALSARLGTAGKERAQSFDWSAIAGQYATVYENVIANTGPPPPV